MGNLVTLQHKAISQLICLYLPPKVSLLPTQFNLHTNPISISCLTGDSLYLFNIVSLVNFVVNAPDKFSELNFIDNDNGFLRMVITQNKLKKK